MASSDYLLKQEIIDELGHEYDGIKLRIFPETSDEDQKLFSNGGLTFGYNDLKYGSCDACWYVEEEWKCPYTEDKISKRPIIAVEATDALNRGSTGNAQYQRFHHALGAVKNGLIGIYYLPEKEGQDNLRSELYGMGANASSIENGFYLINQDIKEIKKLLKSIKDDCSEKFIGKKLDSMNEKFTKWLKEEYEGSWDTFAKKRSTIIKDDYIIKYSARNKRNFTDSSQRAGHIAVGEMYLTKYFFPDQKFYYLWPRMTKEDLVYLDENKKNDKEWNLLRREENVNITTIDDLRNVPQDISTKFMDVKSKPLKGDALKKWYSAKNKMEELLRNNEIYIDQDSIIEYNNKETNKQKRLNNF